MAMQQKILVVDDFEPNLKAMVATLADVDAEIFLASSGNEALALVLKHYFAVILLDVQMPEMNGFEVASILHQDESSANIPIIFVTAISRDEKLIHQGYRTGAVDYLLKPIDADILLSKVNIFLKLSKVTEELNQHKNSLELTISKRTEELVQALEREKEANQAKSSFLANISHELRTPLHGILSFSHIGTNNVEKGDLNKLARYFDRITQSGERLLVLVNDLLDISKLDAGKMQLDISRQDLKQLLETCADEFAASFEDKQLTIHWEKNDIPTIANFDKARIGQVITNLLSNAIKFSETGQSIFISFAEHQLNRIDNKAAYGILCSIRDQGIGIPKNELQTVFDKFIQSSKTSTNAGGTGLGLAICQEIILLHQGKIWAEQAEKNGSVFKFVIPISVN